MNDPHQSYPSATCSRLVALVLLVAIFSATVAVCANVPGSMKTVLLGATLILGTGLFLVLWNYALRQTVALRTKELADSHTLLKAIIEGTTDAIFLKDLSGRYLMANSATCQAIGRPAQEILGRTDRELFPTQSASVIAEVDASVLSSGQSRVAKEFLRTSLGDTIWLANKSPYRGNDGTMLGLVGISRDITELVRAQESLQQSEERFRLAITQAPFPIMIHSEAGKVILLNDTWTELSGYPLAALPTVAAWWEKISLPQDNGSNNSPSMAICPINGRMFAGECFLSTADGRQLIWQISSAPLGDGGAGKRMFISIARDITQERRADRAQKALEEKLRQAQKMETIGTLAGGIAHDFNNILSVILGYCEVMRDDLPSDSRARGDLAKVITAGKRAKELVKQILAFSRQKSAEQMLFQPASIIKESIKLLKSSLPTTIAVETDIDASCGCILADPTQISQVVMNLCTNAFHAMEEHGGRLTLSLKEVFLKDSDLVDSPGVTAGPFVELRVRDTGLGISPAVMPRIFDPYFTTKDQGRGTGLGLAMVHGIVTGMGGVIRVDSWVGQGSEFRIYLPLSTCPPHSQSTEKMEETPTGSEHILLVDDEEDLRKIVQDMLLRLGYRVTVTRDGVEALEAFLAQPDAFDLILTDQTMPGMTGYRLAQQVLQLRPEQAIILCTGYSSTISEEQTKDIGIREFIMKPLVSKDLALALRRVLDHTPSAIDQAVPT